MAFRQRGCVLLEEQFHNAPAEKSLTMVFLLPKHAADENTGSASTADNTRILSDGKLLI